MKWTWFSRGLMATSLCCNAPARADHTGIVHLTDGVYAPIGAGYRAYA